LICRQRLKRGGHARGDAPHAGVVGVDVGSDQEKKRIIDRAQTVKEMESSVNVLSFADDSRHAVAIKFRPFVVDVTAPFQIGAVQNRFGRMQRNGLRVR